MAGKDLNEWLGDQQPKEDTMEQWFAHRPEIAEQVRAGRVAGYSFPQIGAWLIEEHQFPFRARSISGWINQ